MSKKRGTYADGLIENVREDGRVHPNFKLDGARSGRLSCSQPNLQNIPIRSDRGREIRRAFVPRDDDHVLLAADYSQIELRVMAELSGDEGLRDAFQREADIHTETAARVYEVMPDLVSDGENGLQVVEILEAAQTSLESEGEPVSLEGIHAH